MPDVAKLKRKAAEYEQKKQYDKALNAYQEVISAADGSDEVDIPLYNRVGDLYLRENNVEEAVKFYERAVDLYSEAGFFNNAIALCNKILRHTPNRASVFYKLGKISAKKGFNSDAKKNFLEYADRMQKGGNINESFRALKEFADLCPGQDDIRLMLAEQLSRADRKGEALEQLQIVYETFDSEGRASEAAATLERMRAIDPAVEPAKSDRPRKRNSSDGLIFLDVDSPSVPAVTTVEEELKEIPSENLLGLEPTNIGETDDVGMAAQAHLDIEPTTLEIEPTNLTVPEPQTDLPEVTLPEVVKPLTTAEFAKIELPKAADPVSKRTSKHDLALADLPSLEEISLSEPLGETTSSKSTIELIDVPEIADDSAISGLVSEVAEMQSPLDIIPPDAPEEVLPPELPETVVPSVPAVEPASAPRPDDEFVDLGDWLREDEQPKSTRMVAQDRARRDDEQADFSEMLEKFKAGVAANVEEADTDSHYDLGVAYKEMGLLDEAISEFQKALRSSVGTEDNIRSYEALGQCFIEKRQFEVAITLMSRALKEPGMEDEDLVGVLYLLGYASEALDRKKDAAGYYQRVFAIDIEFRDIGERLKAVS